MLQHLLLNGELKIGQHKSISCNVQLEVATLEDDEWADQTIPVDRDGFIDGVRVIGELSFDASPIFDSRDHPIQKGVLGELTLQEIEESTKITVLFLEKSGVSDVVPKHIKRYFWQFAAVGKPFWDKIGIFPKNYRGKNMNRIYTCTDFGGPWPGFSAIVVATDKVEAKRLLDAKFAEQKILAQGPTGDGRYTLVEVDIQEKGAVVLCDGR